MMSNKPTSNFAGAAILLWTAYPLVIIGSQLLNAMKGDAFELFLGLILAGLTIPWIVVGVLQLLQSVAGRWVGVFLTIPTTLFWSYWGGQGALALLRQTGSEPETHLTTCRTLALLGVCGLLCCATSWTELFLYLRAGKFAKT